MNTVIPYTNPVYYDNRPTVGIPQDQVLPFTDSLAFHPKMGPFKEMYDELKLPDEDLSGAYATTVALLMLVGLALASTLGDALGVVPMMNVAAGLYLLAGVVALVMMPAAKQPLQESARHENSSG